MTVRRQINPGIAQNRDAKAALRLVVAEVSRLHTRQALLSSQATRPGADRSAVLTNCNSLAEGVAQARVAVLIGLIDADRQIRGHGRVIDVERSLDGIEAKISEIRGELAH